MTYSPKKIFSVFVIIFVLFAINLPLMIAFAANYQLLEPSIIIDKPMGTGEAQPTSYTLKDYIKTAYLMMFVLVIAATVLYFIMGGLQYMISDIPMAKADGMKKIQNALLGLGVALVSYLILRIINPDLVDLKYDFTLKM